MQVRVDSARCVGHGRCYEIAPAVFSDDERGHCVLLTQVVPPDQEESARRAEGNCPERAITLES